LDGDSFRRWEHGEENGEENQGAAVDDGGCPHVEDARARKDKHNGDCAQTEADGGRHASASEETRCDVGRRSEEDRVRSCTYVRANCLLHDFAVNFH
jgi:hypothetical protein